MTKSELISRMAELYPDLNHQDLDRVINTIFAEITGALAAGDRVELRGFGAFSVRTREARRGRNPRTGETVNVPEKRTPFFKCGKDLKDRLNK